MRPALAVLTVALALLLAAQPAAARPNVVLIVTDDQPWTTLTARSMPATLEWLGDGGARFDEAYASFPLCCPGRAAILTGQYAHNHGVLDNGGTYPGGRPLGGIAAFNDDLLAPVGPKPSHSVQEALRRTGYLTAYVGKYLNGYGQGAKPRVEPDWDRWHALVGTYNDMWGYKLHENGVTSSYGYANPTATNVNDGANHQTAVLGDRAVSTIEDFGRPETDARPFLLVFAPHAPHREGPGPAWVRPQLPGDRTRFATEQLAPNGNYNESAASLADNPPHIRVGADLNRSTPQTDDAPTRTITQQIRGWRRDRMAALYGIDRQVARIRAALGDEADDTVVIFTTDNGFFEGEHRLPEGKIEVYDGAAKVPLLLRAPGVARGLRVTTPVTQADIGATVLQAAGAVGDEPADGRSLLGVAAAPNAPRSILLENGIRRPDGSILGAEAPGRANYAAVRTARYLYVEYEADAADIDRTGDGVTDPFRELYDRTIDPWQLVNRAYDARYINTRADLTAQLRKLRTCAGVTGAKSCEVTLPVRDPQ